MLETGIGAVEGPPDPTRDAAQLCLALDQRHLESLAREAQGRRHPGDASTKDDGPLIHLEPYVLERRKRGRPSHGHAHEILGFERRLRGMAEMDPGALIADVGHLE